MMAAGPFPPGWWRTCLGPERRSRRPKANQDIGSRVHDGSGYMDTRAPLVSESSLVFLIGM